MKTMTTMSDGLMLIIIIIKLNKITFLMQLILSFWGIFVFWTVFQLLQPSSPIICNITMYNINFQYDSFEI